MARAIRFAFHTECAGCRSGGYYEYLESLRMCCLAHALDQLGHKVSIADAPAILTSSSQWTHFKHLDVVMVNPDYVVVPAEGKLDLPRDLIAFKTSTGTRHDVEVLSRCQVYIAHTYDRSINGDDKLLPVPFMAHYRTVNTLVECGLFESYLWDDVKKIRKVLRMSQEPTDDIGYSGGGQLERTRLAGIVLSSVKACKVTIQMESEGCYPKVNREYLRWISQFKVGLDFPGHTEKTDRLSDYAMLGIVYGRPPQRNQVTPVLDDSNSVIPVNWLDRAGWENGVKNFRDLAKNATQCYLNGWSPRGIAKQLVKKLT